MLTQQQINEITAHCQTMGVLYYDVQLELVDHIAGMIDQLQEENEQLNFEVALQLAVKEFAPNEFKLIIKNKEKQLLKRFKRIWLKEFLAYFTFPKILLTLCLTLLIISINHFFNVGEFSDNAGFLIGVYGFYNVSLLRKGSILMRKFKIRPLFPLLIRYSLVMKNTAVSSWPFIAYIFVGIIADILKGILRSKGYIGFNTVKVNILLYPLPLLIIIALAWKKVFIDQTILMRKQYAVAFEN
jgi:hypothetical protein